MKTKFFIILFLIFESAYCEFDLKIESDNYPINIKFEAISIPFEGFNCFTHSPSQFNRTGLILNGTYHKRIGSNGVGQLFQMLYHEGKDLRMISCFGEYGPYDSYWGFAKYLITIVDSSRSNDTIRFYFNSLDSKLGRDSVQSDTTSYYSDWIFTYIENTSGVRGLEIAADGPYNGPIMVNEVFDTIYATDTLKEISPWKLFYDRSDPFERKFHCTSTPFPINDSAAFLLRRNYFVGTTVTFDTVFKNSDSYEDSSKFGYNTINLNYYDNPQIPTNVKGNTYLTPGQYNSTSNKAGIVITALQGDTLYFKKNKRLWINGIGSGGDAGDSLIMRAGSVLRREEGASIFVHTKGSFIDSGATFINSSGDTLRAFFQSSLSFHGITQTINNNSIIIIDKDSYLNLGNNSTLIFDGAGSYLKLEKGAKVNLGINAKIVFKNGAHLIADSITFNSFNNVLWNGIELENAGSQTTITRCTFNNFKTAIKIENTNSSSPNNQRIIQNNDFNFTTGSEFGIFAKSINTALIDNNDFNMSSIMQAGTYIQKPLQTGEGAGGNENPSTLNITNNRFNTTGNGIILAGFTSSNISAFLRGNTTQGSRIGILARKVSGDFKNNVINAPSSNFGIGIFLTEANPDLFRNEVTSYSYTIYNSAGSSPALAPYLPSEALIDWDAGQNVLTSTNYDVMSFHGSSAVLNKGVNTFVRSSSTANHLYGQISGTAATLYAANNCWTPYPPVYNLYNSINGQVQLIHTQSPGFQCIPTNWDSYTVIDKGYGVYDTLFITENGDTYNPDDDALIYGSANEEHENADYFTAINGYKNLINSYTNSSYLLNALNNLYECHTYLDTFDTEEETDILYGSLKTYLEAKINSESYSSSFESEAYNIILSCEANMKNYEQAVEGYEFIALYHPDPEVRLLSSQDYAIIEDLLNGEGGSKINKTLNLQNISVSKEIERKLKKLNKRIISDPILSKVKSSYEETSRKNKEEVTKELNKETDAYKLQKINQLKQNEEKINDRVRNNLIMFKHLSKEDKEKRLFDDILLSSSALMDIRQSGDNNLLTSKYTLSQNYPNPFNPVTTINYQLPKDGIISLIVYDITGKQVVQIEYGFKTSGSYSITFDGSQLSSGVYFYKLTAGNFSEVKRMIMIK